MEIYVKNKTSVLIDKENRFIYEVVKCIYYKNIYSVVDNKLYYSEKEIKSIKDSVFVSPNIEITCKLFAAPKDWIINNGFIIWTKPEKKKRNGKQKEVLN